MPRNICETCCGTRGVGEGWSYYGVVEPGSYDPCPDCDLDDSGFPTGYQTVEDEDESKEQQ